MFHPQSQVLKYHQKSSNIYCLSSLESAFHSIFNYRTVTDLKNVVEESLTLQTNIFMNRNNFAHDVMKNKLRHIVKQHLKYNLKKWKKKGDFDILNDISNFFTLM